MSQDPREFKPAHFTVAVLPEVEFREETVIKGGQAAPMTEGMHSLMQMLTNPPREEKETGFFHKQWDGGHVHAGIVQVCGEGCEAHMPGIEPDKRVYYIAHLELDLGYVTVIPIGGVIGMDEPQHTTEESEIPTR